MKFRGFGKTIKILAAALCLSTFITAVTSDVCAASGSTDADRRTGGGYTVTGQLEGVGYTSRLYNATNGLPTSDANTILADSDGYIWIGGYSGLIRYDGSVFERQDSSEGLTNAKTLFEDSRKRLWVGTNDNGFVVVDNGKKTHFNYLDGLASSTIRGFAENSDGTVLVGSTAGISYVESDLSFHNLIDSQINSEYIIRMVSDSAGTVYGCTRNGDAFRIEGTKVTAFYHGEDMGIGKITTIFADPYVPGTVYLGTNSEKIYHGSFSDNFASLHEIDVSPASNISYICYASGRIWVLSNTLIGYLDENEKYHVLENIPLNSAIENMTEDYQGNLWFTSSRQGVMEIVTSNFSNVTEMAHIGEEVVNSTCLSDGLLYIGTDKGLQIINENHEQIENSLTDYIGDARIRCITRDGSGDLWISTYTNGLGLVRSTSSGEIISYNEDNGFVNNGVRCTVNTSDGSVMAGTNGGLVILKNGEITRTIDAASGLSNTVILTVAEGEDGKIYLGTDGDGIYIVNGNMISKIGRTDGLTSDVILRIKKDEKRGVFWIVTSNSIEYMKDGKIHHVKNFPYTNNYDIYFDSGDGMWILSSYGIYCVSAQDMLTKEKFDYKLYNTADGLPCVPTGNAFSECTDQGDLYVAGRSGVSKVNINSFFDTSDHIKIGVRSIYCNDEEIRPDTDGSYTIPAVNGRIQIKISILNYKLSDPNINIYLEGANDSGMTTTQTKLTALEYTDLPYGDYTLHVQLPDNTHGTIYQEETFRIKKLPRFFELIGVRIALIVIGMALVGLLVWRIMTNTIIRRQYEQIRAAKEEAERANSAKSQFLANMSHEIRTPINTIMGMDEMILREDAADVPDEYFRSVTNYATDIRNASESLLGLVNDLLDMSKIESGKMHLVEQEYDVTDMLRSLTAMIRVRSTQKDLTFDVDIDETLPKRMYGDVGKIKQVVLNLLTNAVKYTEKGGFTLKVSVDEKQDDICSLRFSVKDTGIGVKPEDMDKLFTAYERLDEKKNSGIQGTGLGLDISRRFAGLMNGNLWCESVYGEGSEFILTVKQKIVDAQCIGKFTEHSNEISKGAYVPLFTAPEGRVLVVDDNPMNLNVIKGLLKATKLQVTTASGGEECLDILKKESFHVVLLDHMMPGMDGLETVAHIRETMPDQPVYALTANATAGGDEFYKSKGFDGYLSKPIDSPALERTIMKHLPEELIGKATAADAVGEPEELPEDMLWLNDTEGISVEEGIKNSGGVSSFIFSLNMFLDTMDENAKVIEDAYGSGDIKLYTVKVHALKSSARIIGASELSALAQELENAGNAQDMDFINANTDKFMSDYRAYKEKLSRLKKDAENDTREPVPESELAEAYEALKEVIPQMDYDSVEMILDQLSGYKLPEKDAAVMSELGKKLKLVDWDAMEEIINSAEV